MLNTILFDLDGTLLPLDLEKFTHIYFTEIGRDFQDLIEPQKLTKYIWMATEAMVNSIDERTNETVFMEHFGRLISGDIKLYQQRLDTFYDRGFLKTKEASVENSFMREAVRVIKSKGYQLVVATNPLFPEKAIHQRIRWSGFEPSDFSYITSYERNRSCKPQLHFYREILHDLGKLPDECLMVGNDVQEDLVAAEVNISTFLITDYRIHRAGQTLHPATYQGAYPQFLEFAKRLAPLS